MPKVTLSIDDETAELLAAAANKSGLVRDAVRWVTQLDLTDDRVAALRDLTGRLAALGVDDPIDAAATIAEHAVRDAIEAAQSLLAGGWQGGEILAVMQAMMGTLWTRGMSLGSQLAAEMSDGAALGAVDLDGWGVHPERWADLVQRVAASAEDARALIDVARVFWATQGSQLERMLRRG